MLLELIFPACFVNSWMNHIFVTIIRFVYLKPRKSDMQYYWRHNVLLMYGVPLETFITEKKK